MDNLEAITESLQDDFELKNAARDEALTQSRALIRFCANAIRAIHREAWEEAQKGIEIARHAAEELADGVQDHPDLYQAGYIQDALKELVEACVTYALVRHEHLPTPEQLKVTPATYLNGLAEAASELRRTILDIIRTGHKDEAEYLLEAMDATYAVLMTFDFPDAITGGLRRRVDSLRGVLERTRGDLTNSLRRQQLQDALAELERKLDLTTGLNAD
ncbi:MAG: haloacid dehalogenase [Anaerolineae bacterium]|nr:haloacid dehalogenase [Anaerolineae bacterium]